MARFYESRNIDDSQAQYRIVVRTPDGKRTEINLPRQVFEGIEELQREFWRTERRETRHSLHLASMDEASLAPNNPEKDPELIFMEKLESEALFQAFQQIPAGLRADGGGFQRESLIGALGLYLKGGRLLQRLFQILRRGPVDIVHVLFRHAGPGIGRNAEHLADPFAGVV